MAESAEHVGKLPSVYFTDDQERLINRFRERISDVLHPDHDDLDLLKWLQARKFDQRKAESMYRESMKWRAEVSADTILDDFQVPEVLQKYFPSYMEVIGYDKEGHPLLIDPTGKVDIYGLTYSATKDEITRTVIWSLERNSKFLKNRSRETGVRVHQVVQIIDMNGLGKQHINFAAAGLYSSILRMLQDNYPNMLFRTYIINAPKLFYTVYKILSAVMDENTTNKFIILEGDGKDRLLQDIDPSQLPEYYGGTLTDSDGDGMCKSKICYGGIVPEEYYLKNNKH